MNLVIKVSDETKEKMIKYFKSKVREKTPPYAIFQADEEDTVVTLYNSGKCMFQGPTADVDATMWKEVDGQFNEKKEDYQKYLYCSSIGSDEVGTGDYFGPIVVTSCYVEKSNIEQLIKLDIKDSKKLTDEFILKTVPKILNLVKYKSIILSNREYNEKYNNDCNMNKIKAIMHNKVLYQMVHEENITYDYIIVDEFAREKSYYNYIKEDTKIQRGITFLTKAEDKNLAVATASMISRYIFLKEFDKISDKLHIPLPKGASKLVDEIGMEVVEKYGKDILLEISKYNFKNTTRILKTLVI